MRLKSLNIHAFAKLENVKLDLHQGINLIYGENEAGKSTVQRFIKAMFYGVKGKEREKIFPWNGKVPKGEIIFMLNGEEYILHRTFNASNAKDIIEVRAAVTGEIKKEFNYRNLGYLAFNMGEGAFNKTAYITQVNSSYINGSEEEFTSKLTNLTLSGEEDVSYERAITALEDKIKSIEGKNGIIPRLVENQELLNNKSYEISQNEERARRINTELMDLEAEKEALKATTLKKSQTNVESEETEKLKLSIKKLEKFKDLTNEKILKYKKAYNYVEELRKRILEIREINYTILDLKESLKVQEELLGDLKAFKEVTEDFEDNLFQMNQAAHREIYSQTSFNNSDGLKIKYEKIKKKSDYKIAVLCILFLLLFFVLLFLKDNKIYAIEALSIFIIGIVISLINSLSELKEISKSIKNFQPQLGGNEIAKQLSKELNKYSCKDYKEFLKKLSLYKEHKMDLELLNNKIAEKELQLRKLDEIKTQRELKQCEELIKNILITYEINDFQELEESWQKYNSLYNEIIKAEFEGKLMEKEESETKLREASAKLLEIEKNIITLRNDSKELLEQIEMKFTIIEKLQGITTDIKSYEKKLDALKVSRSILEKSFINIQKDFGPRLNNEVESMVEIITKGKYKEAKIDKNMDVVIRSDENHGIKSIDDFSVGTKLQIYLSVRLSLLKLLYDNNIPIFFDEAFSYYDYDRLYNTLEYFIEEYKHKQVIVFSCQNREVDILDKLNATYNHLILKNSI